MPADLVAVAWIQNRLVRSIACIHGHDTIDRNERAIELLVLQGVHGSKEVARRSLVVPTEEAVNALVPRHLRGHGTKRTSRSRRMFSTRQSWESMTSGKPACRILTVLCTMSNAEPQTASAKAQDAACSYGVGCRP